MRQRNGMARTVTGIADTRTGIARTPTAADSLVTFGDTRLAHGYEANEKLFKAGDSWIGMSGTTAHFPVLRRALNSLAAEDLKLDSRDDVFDTNLMGAYHCLELAARQGAGAGDVSEVVLAVLAHLDAPSPTDQTDATGGIR